MGCHSIAGRYLHAERAALASGAAVVSAHVSLLKWGQPRWRGELLERHGVDYSRTPAEDFATGLVTYRDPEHRHTRSPSSRCRGCTTSRAAALVDGIGPGYALEANSLRSPLEVFIGDAAASSVADAELALEKATASQGLLAIQPTEPDLYGYTDENVDALAAFRAGRSALLDFDDGLEVVRLTMAAYLSAEQGRTIDLTDREALAVLDGYIPLIQQGRGREVFPEPPQS
jgi:predicted dehydrogenase